MRPISCVCVRFGIWNLATLKYLEITVADCRSNQIIYHLLSFVSPAPDIYHSDTFNEPLLLAPIPPDGPESYHYSLCNYKVEMLQ